MPALKSIKGEVTFHCLGSTWGTVDHNNRESMRTWIVRKGVMRGFELNHDK